MKKIIFILVLVLIFFLTFHYKETILIYYNRYFESKYFVPTKLEKNEYARNYNFKYVSLTDNFLPNNKQDILNVYYTVINSGMNEFIFYCKKEYETCFDDVKDVANNQTTISNINNFVHPYNGFKDIQTEIDTVGKITIKINRNYSDKMITILDYEVNKIISENINNSMSDSDKVKIIHDYIINNTTYDQNRSDNNIKQYESDNAYGALIEGHALCGGYTDAMMLFLEKFNIESYKISSTNHIWNYLKLNGTWYNLDLTWDDPISQDGRNILDHKFFLISTDEMLNIDKTEHVFDKTVYGE